MLQPTCYLLDRSLCFRPERKLAGSDFHRRINRALQGTHNNACERAIRPFVLGRRNWLFSDTPNGAHASANLYSIIETAKAKAKANGHEPYRYLRHLFTELPKASSPQAFAALLPFNISPSDIPDP